MDRLEPALLAVDRSTDADTPRRFRARPQDERFRQRAVDALRLRQRGPDEQLEREVREMRLVCRADVAALNIVDGDAVWSRATGGSAPLVLDRSHAFCSLGVQADGLLLITDTRQDPRTAGNPLTTGDDGVRFYAGYPVRTWDGYRIGMMCVLGHEPRSARPVDFERLRDSAARVEQSLWRMVLKPSRSRSRIARTEGGTDAGQLMRGSRCPASSSGRPCRTSRGKCDPAGPSAPGGGREGPLRSYRVVRRWVPP